ARAEVRPRQHRGDLLGDRRLQGAHHTGHVRVGGQLVCRVGAGLRLTGVVLGIEGDGPALHLLGLVGLLDGQVDRVLHAEAERGQRAREWADEADLDGLRLTAAAGIAAGLLPATARRYDGQDAEHGYQAKELVASLQGTAPFRRGTRG